MKRRPHILVLVLMMFSPLAAKAEGGSVLDSILLRFNAYSTLCSPEKVYLHYDRSCYTAGETIWFKGWTQEASRLSSLPPSKFLYAEVLDDTGEPVVRVKIKRTEDGFPGCIELPDNLETGEYTIRAYTLWQLNNDSEYLFHDRLRIVGGRERKEKPQKTSPTGLDVSFWPEGGRYFAGHKSVIGFKVVDRQGRSVDFGGVLVSDIDGELMPVATRHDGMGTFSFLPRPGHRYSVRDASGKMFPLPQPSEDVATLQLQIRSGRYHISTLGYGGGDANLLVRDASELSPLADIELDGTVRTLIMEKSYFRPGINHLLLVDAHGRIMSERLFFVSDEKAPVCSLEMTRFTADQRALTQGVISLNGPDGAPLDGSCSVSVVRGALDNWQQSDGITSYMNLSSELKGSINNPYYYFDPDVPEAERNAALDILMLIQGWRYYDLEKIIDVRGGNFRIRHVRELMQEVRGRITRRLSSKMPRKFTFTFTIPKQNLLNSLQVEQGRYFIIDSLDIPENTGILINIGSSRIGAHYLPKWDGDPAAEPYLYRRAPGTSKDSRTIAPLLNDTALGDTLNAAVVTASYGDEDVLFFGRSYREDLVTFKDLTLVEYVSMKKAMFVYDGENMINRNCRRDNSMSDDSSDSPDFDDDDESGRVKLIVDDDEQAWWSFDMLHLEDLRSLSISTQPDPVYGGDGGVVHISIKPGHLRRDEERNPSLLYFVPLGYQIPRYFDSPRYDRGDNASGSDERNTVWWSPDVKIADGRAEIEFCNSDRMDYPYIIRIEGQSADGRPFSRHCAVAPAGQ